MSSNIVQSSEEKSLFSLKRENVAYGFTDSGQSKNGLLQTLNHAGLNVIECRFIFRAILPLLYFRHLQYKDNAAKKVTESEIKKEIRINPVINKFLLKLTRFENRVSKWVPNIAGGSLLLIAEKKSVENFK